MFDSLTNAWSRPYKIVRVLQALGMDVPLRLRRERLGLMLEALRRAGIEAQLADGSALDADDSPGIEAKVRLRRASPPPTPSQHTMLGYEIVARLPSGGMSECFKVRRDGAVRFLKRVPAAGVHADALWREQQVYEKLGRAEAVNVLRVHDWLRDDDSIALVTEYADGGTLAEHLEVRNGNGLEPGEAKAIAVAIFAGLEELHVLDIVHRDLKPQNVLRCGDQWKLGDFGIAKNLGRLITQGRTFQRTGTPGYAPPEQWRGDAAHPSMDVFAFGKVLVFLLTAQTDLDTLVDHPSWAELARRCSVIEPTARPSLSEIRTALSAL